MFHSKNSFLSPESSIASWEWKIKEKKINKIPSYHVLSVAMHVSTFTKDQSDSLPVQILLGLVYEHFWRRLGQKLVSTDLWEDSWGQVIN